MIPNTAKACLSALLFCCASNNAAWSTIIQSEEFLPFLCGEGTVEVVPLPSKTAQFGIAQTSSAISATTLANSNAEAGYEGLISLSGYTRGGVDSDLREVIIYFKPVQSVPERDITVVADFTAKGRGSQRYQRIVTKTQFSDLSASSTDIDGWRFVRIRVGSKPFDVGELRLSVVLQSDSNQDKTVKFGKIELASSNEVLRDNRTVLILRTINCNAPNF